MAEKNAVAAELLTLRSEFEPRRARTTRRSRASRTCSSATRASTIASIFSMTRPLGARRRKNHLLRRCRAPGLGEEARRGSAARSSLERRRQPPLRLARAFSSAAAPRPRLHSLAAELDGRAADGRRPAASARRSLACSCNHRGARRPPPSLVPAAPRPPSAARRSIAPHRASSERGARAASQPRAARRSPRAPAIQDDRVRRAPRGPNSRRARRPSARSPATGGARRRRRPPAAGARLLVERALPRRALPRLQPLNHLHREVERRRAAARRHGARRASARRRLATSSPSSTPASSGGSFSRCPLTRASAAASPACSLHRRRRRRRKASTRNIAAVSHPESQIAAHGVGRRHDVPPIDASGPRRGCSVHPRHEADRTNTPRRGRGQPLRTGRDLRRTPSARRLTEP